MSRLLVLVVDSEEQSMTVQVLLLVLGAVLTVLTTLLLAQLTGLRKDLRSALAELADQRNEITAIKTVLKLNGCMDAESFNCRKGEV